MVSAAVPAGYADAAFVQLAMLGNCALAPVQLAMMSVQYFITAGSTPMPPVPPVPIPPVPPAPPSPLLLLLLLLLDELEPVVVSSGSQPTITEVDANKKPTRRMPVLVIRP